MATGVEETIAFGITKAAITALAKPVAQATFAGLKSVAVGVTQVFENRLVDYVRQQAEKHSCLSTIVFGHQKSLHDLYVPLTVVPASELTQDRSSPGIQLDRFKREFLPQNPKVLITDTAGMGKSTLSKFLFLQCLKSGYAIPFYVELRHLSDKATVMELLYKQLNPTSAVEDEPKFSKRQIQRMLKKNSLIFFFDGYDEITPAHREVVTKDIKELVENYPQQTYVITSRPESGLLAFPAFKQYNIRPLKLEESFNLIRRYDEGGGRSEQLISRLQGRELKPVREFLKNPLLTSLLYRSFEYKQSVPLKKHVFYRQVFDSLFDWHDATKDGYNTREKKSGLDIDTFHRMLRVIGFYSVVKGQVEGDTDIVLSWIRKAKEVCNISKVAESHFLEDLIRAVPIFVKEGDFYRWAHKSLSEYFAAQYICTDGKAQQQKILQTFLTSRQTGRFVNVLDQIYDIDNNGFREHLTLPAAKAFAAHWEGTYKRMDPSIPDEDVRLRRAATFDRVVIFFKHRSFFNNFDDLKKNVETILKDKQVDTSLDSVRVFIGEEEEAILIADGPYCTVLSVLEDKNDPLVLNRKTQTTGSNKTGKLPTPRQPTLLRDDPMLVYNNSEHFQKVTMRIVSGAVVANHEKLLGFEAGYKDAMILSSFADELLSPLSKGT